MSTTIHETSIIESGAELGEGVIIGPFCHVGSDVIVGDNSHLLSHVSLCGSTRIGTNARIFPFASVGSAPQDLKYAGEKSELVIGDHCLIREGVTVNTGTSGGGNLTRIGNHCVLLAYAHIAHDCSIGNHVILSNAAMLAGHCVVGDHVIFGGGAGVHQFCRIGSHSFIGGMAGVDADILPFGTVLGNRAHLAGVNIIGMKRAGIERPSIHSVRHLYKGLFDGSAPIHTRAESLRADTTDTYCLEILDFILYDATRPLCVPDKPLFLDE